MLATTEETIRTHMWPTIFKISSMFICQQKTCISLAGSELTPCLMRPGITSKPGPLLEKGRNVGTANDRSLSLTRRRSSRVTSWAGRSLHLLRLLREMAVGRSNLGETLDPFFPLDRI